MLIGMDWLIMFSKKKSQALFKIFTEQERSDVTDCFIDLMCFVECLKCKYYQIINEILIARKRSNSCR